MAKGQEAAKIVEDFSKEVTDAINFLKTMVPCIIPNSEEDGELLKQGLAAINYVDKAFKDCNGSLRDFDEVVDVDKIVEEYPKIRSIYSSINHGDLNIDDVLGELGEFGK